VSAVKEAFNAKIEDDKDTKDEIEIEAPNEKNIIKYVVDNDDNVKSKNIISTDNGEQEEENIVNDKHLEDDIIDVVDKINDIKDRVQAEELRRLTGGDKSTDSDTVKKIKKIFKNKNTGNPEYICNCDGFMSFLDDGDYNVSVDLLVEDIHKIDPKYYDRLGWVDYVESEAFFEATIAIAEGLCIQESSIGFQKDKIYVVDFDGIKYRKDICLN
jgi:hypothetical protein